MYQQTLVALRAIASICVYFCRLGLNTLYSRTHTHRHSHRSEDTDKVVWFFPARCNKNQHTPFPTVHRIYLQVDFSRKRTEESLLAIRRAISDPVFLLSRFLSVFFLSFLLPSKLFLSLHPKGKQRSTSYQADRQQLLDHAHPIENSQFQNLKIRQ